MRKIRGNVVAVALLAAFLLPASALAQSGSPAAARVRHFEGGVTVQRAEAGETAEVLVNLPLEAGDRLWTAGDGRAEIVLPDGSFLWLDASTTIDVTALADYRDRGETIVRLWSGSLILRRERYEDDARPGAVRIDSPTGSAVLGDEGVFRIDLDDEQRFWLSVLQGRGELVAGEVSEPLSAGERSFAEAGTAPARAIAFNTAEQDSFDRWQQDRLAEFAVTERHVAERQYVPRTVAHHAVDLEHHGNWGYYDDIGAWGWRPSVSVGWSPYRHGRWVHTHHGWSWVSHASWGWATSHYGRWHFTTGHGWLWFPGRVYAPAWVNWYVSPGFVGWVPLNYWNRPVVSLNAFFGRGPRYHSQLGRRAVDRGGAAVAGRGYVSGLDRAWTFVPADRLGGRDVGRVAVERTAIPREDNSVQVQGPLRPRDPGRELVPSTPSRVASPRQGAEPSDAARTRPSVRGGPGSGERAVTPRGPTRDDTAVRPSPGTSDDGRARTVVPRRSDGADRGSSDSAGRTVVPRRPDGADRGSSDSARRSVVPRRPTLEVERAPRPGSRDRAAAPRGTVVRPGTGNDGGRSDPYGDARRRVIRPDRGSSDGSSAVRRPAVRSDAGSRGVIRPPVSGGDSGRGTVTRRPTVRGDHGGRSVTRPSISSQRSSRSVARPRSDSRSMLQRIFGGSGSSSVRSRSGSPSRIVGPRSSSPRTSIRSRSSSPRTSIRSRSSSPRTSIRSRSSSSSRSARPRPKAKPKESGGGF